MTMLYSLIIPHYNDAPRLERLLHSVPVSRDDIQVLVVDDCSPDQKALDAVRSAWPQVHWLSTPENAGAGVARNVGLDAASGRWLVFADSDDEFLPGAFDTFDRVLRADDELVYFLAEAVQEQDGSPSVRSDEFNKLVSACKLSQGSNKRPLQQLKFHHVVPWAKIYSRAFVSAHHLRFDSVRLSNDLAFNVLAAVQAGKVHAETRSVYRVYRRPDSLTDNMTANEFFERFLVDRALAQRLAKLGVEEARPATGYMLQSLRYRPGIMFKVWYLAVRSPMNIEWMRIFEFQRWRRFIVSQRRKGREQSK